MPETSGRLLRLLSLLQSRRDLPGAQLAKKLGVSTRTIRTDIQRLRHLGYPVRATTGINGGYQIEAGATLPPLLFDDEEAIAVAVGLRTAAGGAVTGIEETSIRALTKLEQVLPARLRDRLDSLHTYQVPVAGLDTTVQASVLTTIATACRDHQHLRFDYQDEQGVSSTRDVEPHRLVYTGYRWYVVAWDRGRKNWRTFRVDRLTSPILTGVGFVPREEPDDETPTYVTRRVGSAKWKYRARVKLHAPAAEIAEKIPPTLTLKAIDEHSCLLICGADTPYMLAVYLGMLDVDFEVTSPPELVEQLAKLAKRYRRAST